MTDDDAIEQIRDALRRLNEVCERADAQFRRFHFFIATGGHPDLIEWQDSMDNLYPEWP